MILAFHHSPAITIYIRNKDASLSPLIWVFLDLFIFVFFFFGVFSMYRSTVYVLFRFVLNLHLSYCIFFFFFLVSFGCLENSQSDCILDLNHLIVISGFV